LTCFIKKLKKIIWFWAFLEKVILFLKKGGVFVERREKGEGKGY